MMSAAVNHAAEAHRVSVSREKAIQLAEASATQAGFDLRKYAIDPNFDSAPSERDSEWHFVFFCKVQPQPVDCGFEVSVDSHTGKTQVSLLP